VALSLADILDLQLLREAQAEVVSGVAHLDREVRWVHISEQPDVGHYLKGGELLCTTGMGLGSNQLLQRRFVNELANVGIAGLVIRLGGTWREAPAALVSEAVRLDLPVIVLHRRFGLIRLTELIHGAIINSQYELLKRAESIGRGFTELFMRGADIGRILEELAHIVQNPVILEDTAHQVMDFATHHAATEDVLRRWRLLSRAEPFGVKDLRAMGRSSDGIWADVWIRDERWGRLHVLAWERSLDEIDELAVDRAVAAVALGLLAAVERHSRADRARDNLIADILGDRYGGEEGFFGRAESCRAHFQDSTLAAMALVTPGLKTVFDSEGTSESGRVRIRRRLQQGMQRAIETTGAVALSGLDGEITLAIVGVDRRQELRAVLNAAGNAVCWSVGEEVANIAPVVGVSEETTPKSLRHAFAQAIEAAESLRGRGHAAVVHFSDLGLYHLLMQLSEGPELARFVEAQLSPLLDYDARRKSQLAKTLRVYLDCNANKSRAAQVLCIERRSLYHRLFRISEVLGINVDDQETTLRLRVALRGLDLLSQRAGSL